MLPKKNVRSAGSGCAESGRPRRPMPPEEDDRGKEMSVTLQEVGGQTPVATAAQQRAETVFTAPRVMKSRPQTLLAIPVAASVALAVHFFVPKTQVVPPTHFYPIILVVMLGLGFAGSAIQPFSLRLRLCVRRMCPILG